MSLRCAFKKHVHIRQSRSVILSEAKDSLFLRNRHRPDAESSTTRLKACATRRAAATWRSQPCMEKQQVKQYDSALTLDAFRSLGNQSLAQQVESEMQSSQL